MSNWANKDALLGLKVPRRLHTIPDVGDVWIHGLTVGAKDEYEDLVFKVTAGSRQVRINNARALLVIRAVHDRHGKPFFAAADLGRVINMPATVIEPIYEIARELSGMATGEVEQMVKNSEAITEPDSATGSPATSE